MTGPHPPTAGGYSPTDDTTHTATGSGSAAAEPPPLTAFAWRHGLVRPVQGRVFAGVSGAFARATNTDPVLWRVCLVVLTIFAGIGALIYVLAWLMLPADGDSASPIEALAGRGYSRTATVRTIIGLVLVLIFVGGYLSEPWRATPLLAAVLLGAVLLLLLRDRRAQGPVGPTGAGEPARSGAPVAPPTWSAPGVPPMPPAPGAAPMTAFAPRGPFAPPPVPAAPPVGHPQRPRRERSRLGGIILSVVLLALGGLTAADLLGASLPAPVFVATALGVIGLGLVVGAWFGRARWIIPFGIALSLAFGGVNAIHNGQWNDWRAGQVRWTPASLSDVQSSYHNNIGDATLDLSTLDFDGRTYEIAVRVDVGNLRVILPDDVDVTVDAKTTIGHAQVFDQTWDGVGQESRTITNLGQDGTGGGRLRLTATVHTGNLEVTR